MERDKIKTLHVEDDPSWEWIFEEVAGDLGIELKQFTSGPDAFEFFDAVQRGEAELPDVVITDLHLGDRTDQSGYEIARIAIEAGVPNVTIASSTGTPSQQIEGVVIQEKPDAVNWLKDLVST